MKNSIIYIVPLLLLALFTSVSCQEIVDLDLEQSEPKVVVEGKLTNRLDIQEIKLSRSINYYDTGKLPPINDASIQLFGADDQLISNFQYFNEDSLYKTPDSIALLEGNRYKLQIELSDRILEAQGEIIPNATLDSIYYISADDLKDQGQAVFGEGYFLFAQGNLNNEGIEYFRLQVYVNDTLQNSRGDISNSILTSEFFGKEFLSLPIPGNYDPQDTINMELYTLNEDVYQYYVEYVNLLFNDGGVFSPPPVNPTTNIVNTTDPEDPPLGFVQFSSVISRELVIREE